MSEGLSPLKRIMVAEGRRQSWLAQQVGKDQGEMSRIVNRDMIPDEKTRLAIAAALVRDPAELWPELHEKAAA